MKITRRSDKGKGGHLLISVPARRIAEVENALSFLEEQHQQAGSHVVIGLIIRAARRRGWKGTPAGYEAVPPDAASNGTG